MSHKKLVGSRSIGTYDLHRVDLQNIVLVDLCPDLVIPEYKTIPCVHNNIENRLIRHVTSSHENEG